MKIYLNVVAAVAATSIISYTHAAGLSLDQAITQSIESDTWLASNRLKESALRDESTYHKALPDPVMSIGMANLPTDSWAFNQENMTQLQIGITQRFPGGSHRKFKARKSQLMADVNPYQRVDRKAQLIHTVSHLWLDSYFAQRSIVLIENERYLFEQLAEITTARYQSALGNARQQDVVSAQLELSKLEDRLTRLQLQYDTSRQLLAQWLPRQSHDTPLSKKLPANISVASVSIDTLKQNISMHPQLRITGAKIDIQQADIGLAKQSYKPDWALHASYGYRDDSPTGIERSDFFSIGVSFDLPVLTSNRQGKAVSAANLRKQALSLDYQLLQKKLLAQALKTQSELDRLDERYRLYQNKLLKLAHEQAEAALSAYTNDDGDFADVVRAYIVEINSKIEALEITIKQQKALATMNYLQAGVSLKLQENNHDFQ